MTTPLTKPKHPLNTPDNTLPPRILLSLDDIEGTDLPLVGGKSFRLAQLRQHGFNVPPGMVLTTTFFKAHIQHEKLTPLWAGSPDIAVTAQSLDWLADALKTKPLSRPLIGALTQHLNAIFASNVDSFAVRSSVIDEDQRDHTFAGIHLSELGVPRAMLPISITRCWASALSGPALAYRQQHGMSIQGIQIAVLIQPMLAPNAAGVGFTLNPLTGARDEIVIEATWGQGSRLVAGDIQPYFYRVSNQSADYPLLEQQEGNVPPPAGAPDEPLSATDRIELARQMEQIQLLMGDAQDIEWARQNEELFILQTRPIVAAPTLEKNIDYEWTQGHLPEDLPDLPSPLFGALLERVQNQAIQFYQAIGIATDDLGPYEKLILGRPYLNLTFLKRGMAQVGINPDSFLQTMGYGRPTTTGHVFSIDWKSAWKARKVYRLALTRIFAMRGHVSHTAAVIREAAAMLANPDFSDSTDKIVSQFRQQDRVFRALFTTNLGLTLATGFITGLGSRLLGSQGQSPAALLTLPALEGIETSKEQLHSALVSLSQSAKKNEDATTFFETHSFEAGDDIQAMPAKFKAEFEALLARYGHHATFEADPAWPRYRDDPASLLKIIKQYIKSDAAPPKASIQNSTQPASVAGWRRRLVKPFIGRLHRLYSLRSHLDEIKAEAMAACRTWNLALGKKWAGQNWLNQPDDIFWLTLDEIERALMLEKDTAVMLSSTVQARKETYRVYAETDMPFYLKESQLAAIQLGVGFSDDELASDVTIGLPVSPGQARGTVVVVKNLDEFEMPAGEDIILVMPSTDPAWLALLHSASGLIVETGGLLSHGSVIAREYGLPAVAHIPQATQRFRTGDKVLVDGSTGVVQRLDAVGNL